MDVRLLPIPLSLQPPEAAELAHAAFREDDSAALEQAHQTLYALYADRIWRAPHAPARARFDRIRTILEAAFRDQLDRRRAEAGAPLEPPAPEAWRGWFEELALGDHPLDDTGWGEFVRNEAPLETMRSVVAQRSLFFLREPDPWIYAVPTLSGPAKAGLVDLLLDEYGWGKFERMHSSVYARAMAALGLETERDRYEAEASWQFLATLNHQWMCALDNSLSRRLLGTIYLTEADSPQAMTNYLAAWERLGIDDPDVREFYELHVQADENHRDVALGEVVLPVALAEGAASAAEIAAGIFDARTLEADFAATEIAAAAAVGAA